MQPKPKAKVRTTEQVLKGQAEQAKAEQARAQRGNTAIAKAVSSALALGDNPWREIGAELDKYLGWPLLKFTKQGEFAISDVENILAGTRCIAHADEITLGWIKWVDGRPDERRVGRVADKFVPPQRSELGDDDPRQWELQDDGTRRDPWQFQMTVPISRLDTGETYEFATSSKGGLACVGKLTRAYGRRVQEEKTPGLPIVELKADHYKHRTYGKIFTPLMIIVGWTDGDGKPLPLANDLNDEIGF
jgi:hypothetical protein